MTLPFSEGTLFAGRYRIVKNLAAGGMGAVYEVVHVETNRRKALKVMHAHLFEDDEMRERFKREARISAEIESEYIVDVSDAGVDEATKVPFLVMELLRGEELRHRLKRVGRFSPHETLTYLRQIAAALDKTHAASIVHRDLKPGNIFWTQREDGSPRVKILDFGVAKQVVRGATKAAATQVLGSPAYMAPEQFCLDTCLTPAVDVFALGMMAYEFLVGESYWYREDSRSANVLAFAMVVCRGPQDSAVERATKANVLLPQRFDVWFAKITAYNPTDRFSTTSEAVEALGQVFENDSVAQLGDSPCSQDQMISSPLETPPSVNPSSVNPSSASLSSVKPSSVSNRLSATSLSVISPLGTATTVAVPPFPPAGPRKVPWTALLAALSIGAVAAFIAVFWLYAGLSGNVAPTSQATISASHAVEAFHTASSLAAVSTVTGEYGTHSGPETNLGKTPGGLSSGESSASNRKAKPQAQPMKSAKGLKSLPKEEKSTTTGQSFGMD